MRSWLSLSLVGVSVTVLVASPTRLFQSELSPRLHKSNTFSESSETERQRIQNRLQTIELLLRSRDVSSMPKAWQTARKRNLAVLRAYWQRGEFPKNTNRGGERVPFFIDAYGTPCAVGHLIIESGNRPLAERIASLDNNIYADKITDPEFSNWAKHSGLYAEELFLIQPTYDQPGPPKRVAPTVPGTRRITLSDGMVCYDTSTTFLMRDLSSSCGSSTIFCSTPLRCYDSSTRQYLGGGVATCRARTGVSNQTAALGRGVGAGGQLRCPDLQTCADDPRQEFIAENESWRWRPSDPVTYCRSGWCGTTETASGAH